jgi:hypothetical protein
VRIFSAARIGYRLFDEPRSRCQKAGQDLRLPVIDSANHAWMLAVDDEFAICNGVGVRRSSGEDFVGLAEFARDQQGVAQ